MEIFSLLYTFLALCPLLGVPGNHPLRLSMSSPIQMQSQEEMHLTMEMNVSSPGNLIQKHCVLRLKTP